MDVEVQDISRELALKVVPMCIDTHRIGSLDLESLRSVFRGAYAQNE